MNGLKATVLSTLLHLLIFTILMTSWHQEKLASFNSEKEPVVWLINKSSKLQLNKQIPIFKIHQNSLPANIQKISRESPNNEQARSITSPERQSNQASSFIKMLHDSIAAQLVQNIKNTEITPNLNYSFAVTFHLSQTGQINDINLISKQSLPNWLKALIQRSLHEISPIALPNPKLGNSSYQIPINLELTQ